MLANQFVKTRTSDSYSIRQAHFCVHTLVFGARCVILLTRSKNNIPRINPDAQTHTPSSSSQYIGWIRRADRRDEFPPGRQREHQFDLILHALLVVLQKHKTNITKRVPARRGLIPTVISKSNSAKRQLCPLHCVCVWGLQCYLFGEHENMR